MSHSNKFVAACLQLRSGRNPQKNRDNVIALARYAIDRGATYIQTPEMTNIIDRDRENFKAQVTSEDQDIVLTALRELAKHSKVTIHVGSIAVTDGDFFANRAYVIDQEGAITARYTKIHLFDVDLPNGESWRESASYRGGEEAVVVQMDWGKLGLGICYDVRFPHLYRSLAQAGAACLTAPACFTKQTGEAHWHILQRARAIENGAFMLSAAQCGLHEDGRETFGHSLIIDPWGRVIADGGKEPGFVIAEIDLSLVDQVRKRIPSLQHDRHYSLVEQP